MIKAKISGIILSTFFVFFQLSGIATANANYQQDTRLWTFSGKIGSAWLFREFYDYGKFLNNEFKHQPGLAIDLGIYRSLNSRWEPGINFGIYRLSGESDLPDFSANGIHPSFLSLYEWPVQYVTVSTTFSGQIKYHLFDRHKAGAVRLDPFVELGAGVIFFFTQLGYSNPPSEIPEVVIFGKGTGDRPRSEPGNVMQVSGGLGTEIDLPQNISLMLSFSADVVNYDCMDAVYNYTNGERNNARTIVFKIMTGILIPIGSSGRKPVRPGSLWGP